ncbi:MAG: TonB-dependent receptor [Bacteroidota bacterium]
MRLLLSLVLSVGLSAAALAQGTLSGTVTDAASGEPLAGVNVYLQGTTLGAATDADGMYSIPALRPGNYIAVVAFVGYVTAEIPTVVSDGANTLDVALDERLFEGEEVVVSGTLTPEKLTDTPATIEVISAEDIQYTPAYSPGELIARQKGVDYFRAGIATTAFNVRGFNSNFNAKNLQVTDGRYSTLVATGLPFGPLDPTAAEDIQRQEIVLGPNGALFGPNAHNGLINTITKDPRRSLGTTLNIKGGNQSTFAAGLRHAQILDANTAVKVNVEYFRAEEFDFVDSVYIDRQAPRGGGVDFPGNADEQGFSLREGYPEYQLNRDVEFVKGGVGLYYTPARDVDLILSYNGSNSTYLSPTNVGRNQIIDWRIHVLQAQLVTPRFFAQFYSTFSATEDTYAIDQRTKNFYIFQDATVATLGAQGLSPEQIDAVLQSEATQTELARLSLGNEALFVDKSRRLNAEAQYRDTFGAVNVVAGVQWQRDLANSDGSYLLDAGSQPGFNADGDQLFTLDEFIKIDQVGGYGQVSLDAGRLGITGAFRYDYHEIYDTNFLPKIGLTFDAGIGTFRATYGRGIAAPTILNLYGKLFGGLILGNSDGFTLAALDENGNFVVDGDGNLVDGATVDPQTVEKQQTFEVGFKGQVVPRRLFVDVNGYYNISEDFLSPLTVLGVATRRGDTPIDEVQPLFGVYNGLVASYINFGEFQTYGADLGLTLLLTNDLSATVNYSFFDLLFDEDDLENNDFNGDGVVNEFDHLVNAPNNKASFALNYNGPRFFGTVFARWVEEYNYFSSFQIASETYADDNGDGVPDTSYRGVAIREGVPGADSFNYGPLGGFVQLDLGVGFKVTSEVQLSAGVTNVFDEDVREFTAAPPTGRLFSAGVRVNVPGTGR